MLPMFPARYAAQTGETSRDTLTEHSYTATARIRIRSASLRTRVLVGLAKSGRLK